jgi:hypothetical protein
VGDRESRDALDVNFNPQRQITRSVFLPLSGHSGHGRNCCSLDPVAIDPTEIMRDSLAPAKELLAGITSYIKSMTMILVIGTRNPLPDVS